MQSVTKFMNMITLISISIMFVTVFCPSLTTAAPYIKPANIYRSADYGGDDCCNDELGIDESLFKGTPIPDYNENTDNLLYIPFPEIIIRDFGIHKYVINRNINTLMNYHTDSHLINIVAKSINQSVTEITRLVAENRAEFDAMAENKFIANFLDFWCAYRMVQLSEFSTNNLDILANMVFKDTSYSNKEL